MKETLKKMVRTKWVWAVFLVVIIIIFSVLYNIFESEWLYVMTLLPIIPFIVYLLAGIGLVFFVKPIKWVIKKIKK